MLIWLRSLKRWLGFCDGWKPEEVARIDKMPAWGGWGFHDWEYSANRCRRLCRKCGRADRFYSPEMPFEKYGWYEEGIVMPGHQGNRRFPGEV